MEHSLAFERNDRQINGHSESTEKASALSSDSVRRVTKCQTAGTNARGRLFALLEAQGVPAVEADDLVAALEAGAVAGAQCEVVKLGGMAPASSGLGFEDGWDERVMAVSEAWWASRTGTGHGVVAGRPGPLNWPYLSWM
ncbi:hypothetical protein [Streptomyces sioyaensis]|uniref:hypothetical protein n=1 Tax=Streptomyces sioyaensis TaxID=67364 RepID=UPI0036DFE856